MKARKLTSLLLVLVLVFAMSASAFAAPSSGTVTVSIRYGDFDTDGNYTGWNVACTQGSVIDGISSYGTNYVLFDGMEIIFDVSPYIMYWPV